MITPVITAICGDPGGANAVAPVVKAVRAEGFLSVDAFAYRQAQTVWTKSAVEFRSVPEDATLSDLAEYMRRSNAKLLLTGTSVNGVNVENKFIEVAKKIGIPSLSVLDFWSNYCRRFSDNDGNLAYVPDRIAIMDQRTHNEMVACGFRPQQLVITGQPAFDDLARLRYCFTSEQRNMIRGRVGSCSGERLILFASQPLSYLYGTDPANSSYPGYDEYIVIRELIRVLEELSAEKGDEIRLVVRPHPREAPEQFAGLSGQRIKVVVSTDGDSRDLVMSVDLVCGMTSVLLVEACLLGCLTVSLQPGLRVADVLPTNSWGISRAIYETSSMKRTIAGMLFDDDAKSRARSALSGFQLESGATERVKDLIYQMVHLDPKNR